jgi:hypothetical protein
VRRLVATGALVGCAAASTGVAYASAPPVEVPVVRAPHAASVPASTSSVPARPPRPAPTATAPSTPTGASPTTALAPRPVPAPATTLATAPAPHPRTAPPTPGSQFAPSQPPTASPTAPVRARQHLVRPGDNLWTIARDELLARGRVARVDDAAVARYWRDVIAANRATLRSGNPNLIFPGELVTLPSTGLP